MTNFTSTHKFSAAAAFGAAALFSMLSFGGNAEAASVTSCKGNTAGSVISCCEQLTAKQRPMWMIESRSSCSEVAVCRGKGGPIGVAALAVAPQRCFIKVVYKVDDSANGSRGRRGSGQP